MQKYLVGKLKNELFKFFKHYIKVIGDNFRNHLELINFLTDDYKTFNHC